MELQRVELVPNEHELVLGRARAGIRGKAVSLACELENIPMWLIFKPENAFGSKDIFGKLLHQKMLKLRKVKGAIAAKRHRNKMIGNQMVRKFSF